MTSQAHNTILFPIPASQKAATKQNSIFKCFVMVVLRSYS